MDLIVKLENIWLLFFSPLTSPSVKWFGLTTQISFIKFQLTIKGGPLHYLHSYEPGKWNIERRLGVSFLLRLETLSCLFFFIFLLNAVILDERTCIQTPALSSTHRPAVAQHRLAGTPLDAASILLTRFHHQWTAPR